MKLAVISPEGEDPREIAVLGGLLAAGLERYHVRKPGWPAEKFAAWLRAFPADWRPRLVAHSGHALAGELGFGGRHGCDVCSMKSSAGLQPAPSDPVRAEGPHYLSRSCHTPAELRDSLGRFDAAFFGPGFPSISKAGYVPSPFLSWQALSAMLARRTPGERRTSVLALGGISAERIPRCRELGFDGVAALGAVWLAEDPVRAFAGLRAACEGEKADLSAHAV